MEPSRILPFPLVPSERLERDLDEIDAAIAMIVGGVATRVRLVGLATAAEVAARGLSRAQAAGVAFCLDRPSDHSPAIIIGPL
ncbi:MAG: hypothetical protein ACXW4H_01410, partial [Candidatus Limnocylindrales bacterium]